jgi:thiamine pyrophosphate-dependent acetolactate synthase large subunit-like protein
VRARPAADWDVAELDRIKRAVAREATGTPAARLVALAREATPAGTLATADVPGLAAWQAVGPHEALSPLGLATPGYAVPAAIAAQLAHPDRRVVAFTNATGLAASEPALRLAVALGLPLVVVRVDALEIGTAPPPPLAGVTPLVCRGEGSFAVDFSRAFVAGRPAIVTVRAPGVR